MQPTKNKTHTPYRTASMARRFTKNDAGFVCANCGELVTPLLSSSRDHCTKCLCSVHVDINPGDRANSCHGILFPVGIERDSKKGIVILYHCDTCREYRRCKSAPDDNYDEIVRLANPRK